MTDTLSSTRVVSLTNMAEELLAAARLAGSGRAAHTVHGGQDVVLRQTVLALVGGRSLGEHESPGEATLQVLSGHVRLSAGDEHWDAGAGDHLAIPPVRHDLAAHEDSVVLLTVVPGSRP